MNKPERFGVRAIAVKELDIKKVKPNPHNPRQLFDSEDMSVLRESIKNVGILVPLTVYLEESSQKYVILDGQRRWMCAEAIGMKKIPVNQVAEPTLVQNIVTMFQIHKLRKDWELMPTALKLELLMEELDERNDRRIAHVATAIYTVNILFFGEDIFIIRIVKSHKFIILTFLKDNGLDGFACIKQEPWGSCTATSVGDGLNCAVGIQNRMVRIKEKLAVITKIGKAF